MTVSPYLFYLLKRMIEFDVERSLRKSLCEKKYFGRNDNAERRIYPVTSHEQIAKYIDKYNKRHLAGGGNYVVRYMWNNGSFNFPERHLDAMVRSVQSLGHFTSWKEFHDKYSKYRYYKLTEKFIGLNPDDVSVNDWLFIKGLVEERIRNLQSRFSQEGRLGINKHNVFFEDSLPNEVRLATEQDIEDISDLVERVYPCPHNEAAVRISWLRKNRKICLVCFDPYGEILGSLTAMPITKSFYTDLKSGTTSEGKMTVDDIRSLDEKQNAECIYIESFATLSVKVQYELRHSYVQMFSNFCDIENDNIIVCAIGGSTKSQSVLEGYGMKKVSEVYEPRAGYNYPFFEATLGEFKRGLEKKIAATETVYNF